MIEAIVETLPKRDLIPSLDLVKEAVHSCDGLTLVIASQDNDLLGESYLQCEQKANDLARLFSSVDVISHEKVLGVAQRDNPLLLILLILVAHLLEHVQQVSVLTMNIPEYFHWCFESDEGFFILEFLLHFLDEELDYLNREVNEGHCFGVLLLVVDDVIIEVVNDHVHDEGDLIIQVLLGYTIQPLLKLLAPLFLDVQCL